MFNKLRPLGRSGNKSKTQNGGPAQGAPSGSEPPRADLGRPDQSRPEHARAEPPRLELPQRRNAPLKMAHLKSVEVPARVGREGTGPVALPGPRPDGRPVAQPVAQPAPPINPARPAIPPYPVPGARAKSAEVQSFGRMMLVGPQIRLKAEIKSCERLVVEGSIEGEVTETERLEIARGGHFLGVAKVESCLIDGLFEGELEVRGVLSLKANGEVKGSVRYGEIEIERGGTIAGSFGTRAAGEGAPARAVKSGGPRPA